MVSGICGRLISSALSMYRRQELCIVPTEGGDPFLSGVWYLPPGLSSFKWLSLVEDTLSSWKSSSSLSSSGSSCLMLAWKTAQKTSKDYELEMNHFVPAGATRIC